MFQSLRHIASVPVFQAQDSRLRVQGREPVRLLLQRAIGHRCQSALDCDDSRHSEFGANSPRRSPRNWPFSRDTKTKARHLSASSLMLRSSLCVHWPFITFPSWVPVFASRALQGATAAASNCVMAWYLKKSQRLCDWLWEQLHTVGGSEHPRMQFPRA